MLAGWSLALAGASLDEGPAWLRWKAPAGCPDARYASDATERRLGREATSAEVTVVATIEGHDGEHRLDLQITRDATLHRHVLRASDCRTLADATGLLVAASIDPIATVRNTPPDAPAAQPGIETPPAPVRERATNVRTEPDPLEPVSSVAAPVAARDTDSPATGRGGVQQLTLALLGGGELGALPAITGGPRLRLGLGWERWSLELAGSYFAPRIARTSQSAVRVRLGVADVRACWRFRRPRLETPLCGGVEAGASYAQGLREPGPRSATGLWLAPSASGGVHGWVLSNLALVARAELAVSAVRTAYDVRDPGQPATVFAPGPVSGRLWIGLQGNLWSRR